MPSAAGNSTTVRAIIEMRIRAPFTVGQHLRAECELPQELPAQLTALPTRNDDEHDPYADIVGTC